MTSLLRRSVLLLGLAAGTASAQMPTPLPLTRAPRPTGAAITAADLMSRLYVFADDSMEGRATSTPGHERGTAYIEAELRKLGITPAGDSGSFFQTVPLVRRGADAAASSLTVDGRALTAGTDFVFQAMGGTVSLAAAPAVYGGALGDTLSVIPAEAIAGRLVVVGPPAPGVRMTAREQRGFLARFAGAAAVATIAPVAQFSPAQARNAFTARLSLPGSGAAASGMPSAVVTLGGDAAQAMFATPVAALVPGQLGKPVSGTFAVTETPAPSRNVVAILEGRDPALKGQYVSVGGHSDHVGYLAAGSVDHDSLKAVNWALNAWQVANGSRPAGAVRDSIVRAVNAGLRSSGRRDSIRNGADDDGSGSMAVLELAERFAKSRQKPRRSILFLWYTGEEVGLLGSRWYTDHPTVSRDSVVANLNIDMIGRGRADDIAGGGDTYVELVGSRRLSTELGNLVEAVNARRRRPLTFDYTFDADGHPENIYCRSDHYNWARYGVPVTFFTTGLHGDYHQVTDEPQYIDYGHYATVTMFIGDVLQELANRTERPVVDKPKPDPNGPCRQ